MDSSLLESGLLPDAIEGPRSEFVARFTRDRHTASLSRMFELAMTSTGSDHHPAIIRKQPKDFADLHTRNYAPRKAAQLSRGLTSKVTGADEMLATTSAAGRRPVDRVVRAHCVATPLR